MNRSGAMAAIVLFGLMSTGCSVEVADREGTRAGETVTETKSFEKSGIDMAQANIEMAAGRLTLEGGSAKLFEGEFRYNVPAFKPDVQYESTGFRGRITVTQRKATSLQGNSENTWNLKLAKDVPLDLNIRCGAGENLLDLRQVTLRSVEVHLGAGRVEIQLPPNPEKSFDVKVHGGVGEAIIRYPEGAGVQAEAAGGLGEIDIVGMDKKDGKWETPSFSRARAQMRLEVKGGIGAIRILPAS